MASHSHVPSYSRREWLRRAAATAAFTALSRRGDARVRSANPTTHGTARACVFVYLVGAPSHVDTFDVKDGPWNPPDANIQQHGDIALSATLFPVLSTLTGDLCLLRSVRSWEAAHQRAQFYMQTTHPENPAFVTETPHLGAVVAYEAAIAGPMPPFLSLNQEGTGPFQGAKFLGGDVEPFAAPTDGNFTAIEHNFFGADSERRFFERYDLLEQLDPFRAAPRSDSMSVQAGAYSAARDLMFDPSITSVFALLPEDAQRYGDTNLGRAAQVARNAVQARNGTSFIALSQTGWDTHSRMFTPEYKHSMYTQCSELDAAIGSLVIDLKASGDFDETLIVMMGEFGRTPGPLNLLGGRDHYKDVMSIAMMGGGVAGNRVIGATDPIGASIVDPGWSMQRPIYMEDIASTVYSALGIDWTRSIEDTPSGRRFEYVPGSESGQFTAVEEVFR